MKTIKLGKEKVALVDDSDFEELSKHAWHFNGLYATRHQVKDGKRNTVYMHRVIMDAPKDRQVDHKDGNGLDNRRENLRLATMTQQRMNQGIQSNNTSGFRGVAWDRTTRGWKAKIHVHRKGIYLGQFSTPQEAAIAYEAAAKRIFGEFRREPLKERAA